ncbi:MAG: hypothetical protein ABSH09_27795, partial [Bryobacteraceae bacterium]
KYLRIKQSFIDHNIASMSRLMSADSIRELGCSVSEEDDIDYDQRSKEPAFQSLFYQIQSHRTSTKGHRRTDFLCFYSLGNHAFAGVGLLEIC